MSPWRRLARQLGHRLAFGKPPPQSLDRQPTLRKLGEARVCIRGTNGAEVELIGAPAARVLHWHEHLSGHGPEWAACYLAGVVDGLAAENGMRIERTLRETRAEIEASNARLAELRKRSGRKWTGDDAQNPG